MKKIYTDSGVGDGQAGECGDITFDAPDCAFNGSGNSLKCRR